MSAEQVKSVRGKGYDNPKNRRDDKRQLVGDIFVVQEEDLEFNPNYVLGNYYISLVDSPNSERETYYFPLNNDQHWKLAWSDIKDFTFITSGGETEEIFYGNGNHQLGISIYFTPIDDTGKPVPVKPEVLERCSITLIDYYSKAPLDSKEWTVSYIKNEFHDLVVNPQLKSRAANQTVRDSKIIYLSCAANTVTRKRVLGCIVAVSKELEFVCGDQERFTSQIKVQALEAIQYDVTKTQLSAGVDHSIPYLLGQENYYFSIVDPNFYILKVDVSDSSFGPDMYWSAIDCGAAAGEQKRALFYYWKLGNPGSTRIPGLVDQEIVYNERINCFCITRFYVASSFAPKHENPVFTIYDQYGNSGRFRIEFTTHKGDQIPNTSIAVNSY